MCFLHRFSNAHNARSCDQFQISLRSSIAIAHFALRLVQYTRCFLIDMDCAAIWLFVRYKWKSVIENQLLAMFLQWELLQKNCDFYFCLKQVIFWLRWRQLTSFTVHQFMPQFPFKDWIQVKHTRLSKKTVLVIYASMHFLSVSSCIGQTYSYIWKSCKDLNPFPPYNHVLSTAIDMSTK